MDRAKYYMWQHLFTHMGGASMVKIANQYGI